LETLRQLSAEVGLADRTLFAGRVDRDQITKYFAASDVFAHGALHEAAGIVLIEAMASGCPVVCTDAGGPAEYVQNGTTGFVVPVRDAESMAAKIGWLLDHPSAREQFGRAARNLAMNRFGRERMIRELIEVYTSVSGDESSNQSPAVGTAEATTRANARIRRPDRGTGA
jgi:glycosyltransferase involved in cell wall biosynthesis